MSSGGYRSYEPPKKDLIKEIEKSIDKTTYDTEVNKFLSELLKEFNNRDIEAVDRHIDSLVKAIEKEIDGVIELLYGGSVSKHTYVNGLSDIDVLARINNTSLEGKSPKEVLKYFSERIKALLPNSEVTVGDLAVTVKYKDGHQIQILPALETKSGLKISTTSGEWSNVIRPDKFVQKLTETNQGLSGKVIPVIKIFKALQENLPKNTQLTGYHIESLAINAFKSYDGTQSYKEMLLHFCKTASENVKTPIIDRTGQSIHVDDYMGESKSEARIRASKYLERLARRIEVANNTRQATKWEELFDE